VATVVAEAAKEEPSAGVQVSEAERDYFHFFHG